jgi:hypothetical protein
MRIRSDERLSQAEKGLRRFSRWRLPRLKGVAPSLAATVTPRGRLTVGRSVKLSDSGTERRGRNPISRRGFDPSQVLVATVGAFLTVGRSATKACAKPSRAHFALRAAPLLRIRTHLAARGACGAVCPHLWVLVFPVFAAAAGYPVTAAAGIPSGVPAL